MLLEDLYYGRLCPAEDAVLHDETYQQLSDRVCKAFTGLEHQLTGEQMEQVRLWENCINELNSYECTLKFRHGFSMGALLMQEISRIGQAFGTVPNDQSNQ